MNKTFELNWIQSNKLRMRIAFKESPNLKNNELNKRWESIMGSKNYERENKASG